MRIEPNKNQIKLKMPKMRCDAPLSSKIPEPLMNAHNCVMFVAPAGSGKTSTLVSLLTDIYKKVFNRFHIIMPHASLDSLPEKHLFRDLEVQDELTGDVLHKIREECEEARQENENSILLIDDQVSRMKDPEVINELKYLILNRRICI